MIKITNAGEQTRGIPVDSTKKITTIAKGQSLDMSPKDWDAIKETKAIAGLVADGVLKIDAEPANGGKKPAKGGDAKTEGGPAQ